MKLFCENELFDMELEDANLKKAYDKYEKITGKKVGRREHSV